MQGKGVNEILGRKLVSFFNLNYFMHAIQNVYKRVATTKKLTNLGAMINNFRSFNGESR